MKTIESRRVWLKTMSGLRFLTLTDLRPKVSSRARRVHSQAVAVAPNVTNNTLTLGSKRVTPERSGGVAVPKGSEWDGAR